ncbi:MAG: hypothetical protein NTY33_03915 [Candidatus Moranbacteria bacterium]|nr:hypothetical protein [Candidatus Moranbacteria bacterium]
MLKTDSQKKIEWQFEIPEEPIENTIARLTFLFRIAPAVYRIADLLDACLGFLHRLIDSQKDSLSEDEIKQICSRAEDIASLKTEFSKILDASYGDDEAVTNNALEELKKKMIAQGKFCKEVIERSKN